jgi:hypothetical protein
MKFKYRSAFSSDPNSDDLIIFRRPEIPLTIFGPLGGATSVGLVDTGADFTIFPKSIADYLGIPMTTSGLSSAASFAGESLPLMEGEVTILIRDSDEQIVWKTDVCFFDFRSSDIETVILGHSSFLDNFIATFDGELSQLELKPTRELLEIAQSNAPS